jgi:hypothetical protein
MHIPKDPHLASVFQCLTGIRSPFFVGITLSAVNFCFSKVSRSRSALQEMFFFCEKINLQAVIAPEGTIKTCGLILRFFRGPPFTGYPVKCFPAGPVPELMVS